MLPFINKLDNFSLVAIIFKNKALESRFQTVLGSSTLKTLLGDHCVVWIGLIPIVIRDIICDNPNFLSFILILNETYQGKAKFNYNFAEGTTDGGEYTDYIISKSKWKILTILHMI